MHTFYSFFLHDWIAIALAGDGEKVVAEEGSKN